MTVTRMAKNLDSSLTMPMMPKIKEAGKHTIIRHPPRVLSGLPQPGCSKNIRRITARLRARGIRAISPKRDFITKTSKLSLRIMLL